MTPITCPGGYGVPVVAGNFTIKHISFRKSADGTASVVRLSDDSTIVPGSKFGKFPLIKTPQQRLVIDLSLEADTEGYCDSDINVRVTNGISPITTSNIVPGSLMVYV